MAKKSGVWKVFSVIGLLLLAVLLCYFSVAMYFYFGKPNDISSKLKVWNLMSNESVGEMYVDASFDIREVNNSNETGYYGINLDERGYVSTLASNVEEGETYLLYRKNGEIYSGTCVFDEENFNLAIIKINAENLSLPFVNVGTMNKPIFNSTYIAVGNPLEENNITNVNEVVRYDYAFNTTYEVDGLDVVDYISENSVYYTIDGGDETSQWALFDKKGNLIGLTYAKAYNVLDLTHPLYFAISVELIDNVLDKIISLNGEVFKSDFVDSFKGFDMYELECYYNYALDNSSKTKSIYFDGKWFEIPKEVESAYSDGMNGYYLVEDLNYNGTTIASNSLIASVLTNGRSYIIEKRDDLFEIIYSLESGDKITINYTNFTENQNETKVFTI